MNRTIRALSCLPLAVVFGCSSEPKDDTTPIHMGATFSKTGVSAVTTWGDAFRLAADDASDGLRQAGFPTGAKLSFDTMVADTRNDVNITVERAKELVQQQGAKLIINGTSSDTVALSKLAYNDDMSDDIDVPIVCVACSSPALHNPNATNSEAAVQAANRNPEGWVFGLAMSSLPQAHVLWNILVDTTPAGHAPGDINGDGRVKISTIALDDAFGIGFQDAMEAVVHEQAPDAIFEKTKHPKDADLNQYDWSGAIDQLTDSLTDGEGDSSPDVIIEFTFPQFSLALVKAYSSPIPFLHTHSMRERTVVLSAEGRLEGQQGTSYLPSDGPSGQMFDEHFRENIEISRQSQWDSAVYDGTFLFALATLKATQGMADPSSVTGAAIRDAMKELNDPDGETIRVGPEEFAKGALAISEGRPINYDGASGPCDFDAYGRAKNRISHWRVNDGQASDVGVYDCVKDASCPKMDSVPAAAQ
ncbi:MAG TPA: ABC transporter substrate-binding protein [Polyangiaceae bacterium]|nr:ABC transporter substrate-binding protein [Polyangiaceae bacterium]